MAGEPRREAIPACGRAWPLRMARGNVGAWGAAEVARRPAPWWRRMLEPRRLLPAAAFALLVAGGATPLSMVAASAADDFTAYMILPEVKDPKNWWGGHIWEDNVSTRKHVYAFLCYTSETLWYNASQADVNEIRSYDDLLNPKIGRAHV